MSEEIRYGVYCFPYGDEFKKLYMKEFKDDKYLGESTFSIISNMLDGRCVRYHDKSVIVSNVVSRFENNRSYDKSESRNIYGRIYMALDKIGKYK